MDGPGCRALAPIGIGVRLVGIDYLSIAPFGGPARALLRRRGW